MSNQDVVLHDKERHMQFSVFEIDPSEGGNYLLTSQIDKTYYLMIIQDTKSRSQLDLGYLQSAYGITNTEHQLISALINGNAEETQLQKTKPSTVRWHLKNIFLKTNTHSQPELARLMLALYS